MSPETLNTAQNYDLRIGTSYQGEGLDSKPPTERTLGEQLDFEIHLAQEKLTRLREMKERLAPFLYLRRRELRALLEGMPM